MSIKNLNDKIEKSAVTAYKSIENGVTGTYKKIEDSVVDTYQKIENKFIKTFLAKEGETTEEAKNRITSKQKNNL